jgi:hypothetical protein
MLAQIDLISSFVGGLWIGIASSMQILSMGETPYRSNKAFSLIPYFLFLARV